MCECECECECECMCDIIESIDTIRNNADTAMRESSLTATATCTHTSHERHERSWEVMRGHERS